MPDTPPLPHWRRLPIGAEIDPAGGVHVRVWAPERQHVAVLLEECAGSAGDDDRPQQPVPARSDRAVPLTRDDHGYHAGYLPDAAPGSCYRFLLDDDPQPYPDPASRWQPQGPHGPSAVVDPSTYAWNDRNWRGIHREGQVLYELHVGTFTPNGTWAAAIEQLPALAELGVTTLEVLPIADFPGRFGWGYDGVNWFAPTSLYGTPDDFRRFVDAAHAAGLGVILDVVYNHLGPDGNFLSRFSPHYFNDRHHTDWGDAINFDGPLAGPVREYVLGNARYWITEFHLDGLRLDATQSIFDDSDPHVLAELADVVRAAAGDRSVLLVAENEPQRAWLAHPREQGGAGLDALWNEDFHHSARVAVTGSMEGYFGPYRGAPQEFVSAAKYGWLYQGQLYGWQGKRRGTPSFALDPAQLVNYIQNHDQVANTGLGVRLHQLTSPGRLRAVTAVLLLFPQTPMLFQGQEFAATSPFLYFADHKPELAALVARGRREFLSQFSNLAHPAAQAVLPAPDAPETFRRSKLDYGDRQRNQDVLALHRDLLRLRREDPVLSVHRAGAVDGAVLSAEAFVLRWFAEDGLDRLLVVNFGRTLTLDPDPEPLLAPPAGMRWETAWASEHPRYGGVATPPLDTESDGWHIPSECAVLLQPTRAPSRASRRRPGASAERAARLTGVAALDGPAQPSSAGGRTFFGRPPLPAGRGAFTAPRTRPSPRRAASRARRRSGRHAAAARGGSVPRRSGAAATDRRRSRVQGRGRWVAAARRTVVACAAAPRRRPRGPAVEPQRRRRRPVVLPGAAAPCRARLLRVPSPGRDHRYLL